MNEVVGLEGVTMEAVMVIEEERKHCIYMITSPSGKSYVGQTNNYNRRMAEHKGGHCKKSLLWIVVDKYGWENLTKEILHKNLTLEEANYLEELEVFVRNTITPDGYNLREGGGQFTMSQETKDKISASLKGRKMSPEWVEKLRLRMIGNSIMTPEAISKRLAKMQGYTHSEETRAKMSESQKNRPAVTEETRLKQVKSYNGHLQTPENIAKSVLARTGLAQSPEHAHHSRTINIGRKHTDVAKLKMSASQKGIVKSESAKKSMSLSQRKKAFDKEVLGYYNNIANLHADTLFTKNELSELLGVTKMVIFNRIQDGIYPNAYVGGGYKGRQSWLIPIQDVHDYYNR